LNSSLNKLLRLLKTSEVFALETKVYPTRTIYSTE